MSMHLIQTLRPRQWAKNLLCLAGYFFGERLFDPIALQLALATVFVFSLGSSAVYIFNDIADRELDRRHPFKRNRPIASGGVGIMPASGLAIVLAVAALAGGWHLGMGALACLCLYFLNGLAYTLYLKQVVLLDVISIAFGFVLRLLAGVYALDDLPTAWILLCVFFLAVFLALVKRRTELARLDGSVELQRPVLKHYSIAYLDSLVNTSATMAILSYALFTTLSGKNPSLIVTLPVVYYGIMYYKGIMLIQNAGEEPERILFSDVRIILSVALWLLSYFCVLYWELNLFQ